MLAEGWGSVVSILLVLFAIVAHELGHLAAARSFGWRGRLGFAGRWMPYPVARVIVAEGASRFSLVTVAAAGPLASVLVGALLWPLSPLAGGISVALGVLSLVPIPKWDGAHIVAAVRS